jgi:hypothetical protein
MKHSVHIIVVMIDAPRCTSCCKLQQSFVAGDCVCLCICVSCFGLMLLEMAATGSNAFAEGF